MATPKWRPESKWQPFYGAVSESFGGISVSKTGTTQPYAWVGQLAAVVGKNASDDVEAAVALWNRYMAHERRSGGWPYITPKNVVFRFGNWVMTVKPRVQEREPDLSPEEVERVKRRLHEKAG